MKQIFVTYETDAWHSLQHRECAGVFTSKWAAVNAIVKNHRIELDEFFSEEEIEKTSKRVLEAEARRRLRKELEFAYQTQGYETNYDIEVWNINEWYLTKLSNMINKQRKNMIEQWVTEINPKAILRAADARCGQGMPSMSFPLLESSGQDALTICLWSSWSNTSWVCSIPMSSTSG